MIVFRPQYLNNTGTNTMKEQSSWFPAGEGREIQSCIHAFHGKDCIAGLERKRLFMPLVVVLCFFNFFMSYRSSDSSIQHYQPIEWLKCRTPFENKDTVLTFTLGRKELCIQLPYTKGKYFKFHKDMTIHKISVEGKHQTQQLPFQGLKGKPGMWLSSTLGASSWLRFFHLREFPCKIPSCTTQW